MNNKFLYHIGDYDIITIGEPKVFRREQAQNLHPQAVQQINYGATPLLDDSQPSQNSPSPSSSSINWDKVGLAALGILSAIALLKYLPSSSPTANTPKIDPVAVREIENHNRLLQQHVRNLENQLLLQSASPSSCPTY